MAVLAAHRDHRGARRRCVGVRREEVAGVHGGWRGGEDAEQSEKERVPGGSREEEGRKSPRA